MSRNVERMKQNGWWTVRPGELASSQELRITKAGRRIIEEAAPLWRKAQGRRTRDPRSQWSGSDPQGGRRESGNQVLCRLFFFEPMLYIHHLPKGGHHAEVFDSRNRSNG